MGNLSDRSRRRARHQEAIRLVAPEPSGTCKHCGKKLLNQQARFCGPTHKNEWHAEARDVGELVMEMVDLILQRRRK